jgi:integrase/recombinase XerD
MNNKQITRFLTEKEIRQIIDPLPDDDLKARRDRALLSVLFNTGLRISEALSLKRADFEGKDYTETLELTLIGKGGFERVCFISSDVVQAVLRYFKGRWDDDPRAWPMTVRTCQRIVKKRAKEAGVEKFISPHVFRHSAATHLLRKGVDIRMVAAFLGHRGLNNVMRYTHVVNEELKRIHEKVYKVKK